MLFFKCIKKGGKGGKKDHWINASNKKWFNFFKCQISYKIPEANSVSSVGCRSFSPHHVRSLDDRRTDGRTAVCGAAAGGFPVASAAEQNP